MTPLEIGSLLCTIFSSATASAAANAIGTVGTGVSAIQEKISQNQEDKERLILEQLTADFAFSNVPAEYQDAVIRHCEQFKTTSSSGRLLRDEDIEAFFRAFFSQNPDALADRAQVTEQLAEFITSYDYYLRKQMSLGEQVLFHQGQTHHEEIKKLLLASTTSSATASTIHTANSMYADAFGRILFLHDEANPAHANVTLANLYVKQRYMERDDEYNDLPVRLAKFVQQDTARFLLIEGDAGSGKTTLVEWLNYYYRRNQEEATDILGTRSLVTIRLRDLNKELVSKENSLIPAIRKYMELPNDPALAEQLCKAVFILDGFDELSMIDKITDYTRLINDFAKKLNRSLPAKIIITSRPKYIQELSFPHCSITLLHFDEEQRNVWLTKYKEDCKQDVAPHIETYIKNIDEDSESAIFDTPMALYMIAARNPDESALTNSWRLYRTIFHEDIRDTEYNQMLKNLENPFTDNSHPASEQWDIYYQISEEIAYLMYKSQNSRLYVDSDDLREIIHGLSQTYPELKDQTMQEITKNCHVLCCYWRTDTEDGVLEFYHNNIRDFFLCEKIYREVNRLYQRKIWDDELTVLQFVELFQYYQFEPRVCQFILQRSECCKDKENGFCQKDFPSLEYRQRHLPDFFQLMVTKGELFLQRETPDRVFQGVLSHNPVKSMSNVLNCVINLFDLAYLPHLKEKETFSFWKDLNAVNKNALLQHLLCVPGMELYLRSANLDGADLTGSNLDGANLDGVNLNRANLTGAHLNRTNLTGAHLDGANLDEAHLVRAHLILANLIFSHLDGAYLVGAHLISANLDGAHLVGANLIKAHLTGVDLSNADLTEAHLEGADLRGATLPDGFSSDYQDEQVEHLKSLNIEGLTI